MSKLNLWDIFEKLTGSFSSPQGRENGSDENKNDNADKRQNSEQGSTHSQNAGGGQNSASATPTDRKKTNTYMIDLLKKHNEASMRIDSNTHNENK